MAKIKLYKQNTAPSFVGVPEMDNSGAILAQSIASTTASAADSQNQIAQRETYNRNRNIQAVGSALGALAQDVGGAMRVKNKQLADNAAKQQAYNDHGAAEVAGSNFNMDLVNTKSLIYKNNVNTPELIPDQLKKQSDELIATHTSGLTQEAKKLAESGIYSARDAAYGSAVTTSTDMRTALNTSQAKNTIDITTDKGVELGKTGDYQGLTAAAQQIQRLGSVMAVDTPMADVAANQKKNLKQLASNFIDAKSAASPGTIEEDLKNPGIQDALKLFTAKEIMVFKNTDQARLNDYFTEETMETRRFTTQTGYQVDEMFGKVEQQYYNPEYSPEQKKALLTQYLTRARDFDMKFDASVTKGEWSQNEAQVAAAAGVRKKVGDWVAKIGSHIKSIDDAAAGKANTQAIKDLATGVSQERVSLMEAWNAKDAGNWRTRGEQLWAAGSVREDMSQAERAKAIAANENYLKHTAPDKTNPSWVARPTIDARGYEHQGDAAWLDKRRGQVLDRLDRLQGKTSKGNPMDRMLGKREADPAEAAYKAPPTQFFGSVGAYSEPARSAVQQELERLTHNATADFKKKNPGKEPSPEKINEWRNYFQRSDVAATWAAPIAKQFEYRGPPLLPKGTVAAPKVPGYNPPKGKVKLEKIPEPKVVPDAPKGVKGVKPPPYAAPGIGGLPPSSGLN